jgi:hypothetical protein
VSEGWSLRAAPGAPERAAAMSRDPEDDVRVLVVRAWREPARGGESPWELRGEVRDPLTSHTRYFRRVDGLLRVMLEMLGAEDPGPRRPG